MEEGDLEGDQLPNEIFFSIAKYIEEDIDSFSLALSGAVKGFADFYGETRWCSALSFSRKKKI